LHLNGSEIRRKLHLRRDMSGRGELGGRRGIGLERNGRFGRSGRAPCNARTTEVDDTGGRTNIVELSNISHHIDLIILGEMLTRVQTSIPS
jgi:hypothetical protein